jgi:uroporphyrinogen decarboxylase
MKTMSSVDRVETVLAGRIPDRVPVDLADFMMAAQASGTPFPDYLHDGEAMAEGHIRAWRLFGHDVVVVETGTASLSEACGAGVEYPHDSAPVTLTPAISDLDDLDRLVVPDPYEAAPLALNLKATRIIAREVGEGAFVIGRADQGPFSLASMLLGMEGFLMALMDPTSRPKLHRLLAFCEEAVYRYAVAQIEQGAHMTSIGESLAGPDVCSPAVYREFAWPYDKRLTERLTAKGIRLACHICGDATQIVDDMVATGASVLELDYKCDLGRIKAAAEGRSTILGVIDPSAVMTMGTPEAVADAVRDELGTLAPNGGLILGPGCALPATTPPENVHALIEATHRWGRYQPDGRLVD